MIRRNEMAALEDVDSISDFVNCHVCRCEYDADVRKPKFLPCSHTVCILCLRVIYRGGNIACPTCHLFFGQEPDSLSTNQYVLQMLKLKEKKIKKDNNISSRELRWCVEPESLATSGCSSSQHSSINMANTTSKHLDDFVNLKKDFQRAKDEQANKLPIAIEMRTNIEEDLSLFKESATLVEREIEKLREENNIHLKELMDLNDSLNKGDFLPELATFLDDSTPGETIDTLFSKIKKYRELCENKLQDSIKAFSDLEFCNENKVVIHLYDEDNRPIPTFDLFERGFRLESGTARSQQDLKLISHLISSILKKVNGLVEQISSERINNSTFALAATSSLPPDVPVLPNFVLGQSVFFLWLTQSNKTIGSFCIRPTAMFNPLFVQKLGDHCFHSPMRLPNQMTKAVSGNYLFLPVIHPELKELFKGVSSNAGSNPDSIEKATEINDVGINFATNLVNRNIVGWSFTFILHSLSSPTKKMFPTSDLFGRFSNYHGLEAIRIMNSTTSTGEGNNYSLSLESR